VAAMDRALIDGSAATAGRRSEESVMTRPSFAHANVRVRALGSLIVLASIALVTEAGHRWS
jgi:hypothetical protein